MLLLASLHWTQAGDFSILSLVTLSWAPPNRLPLMSQSLVVRVAYLMILFWVLPNRLPFLPQSLMMDAIYLMMLFWVPRNTPSSASVSICWGSGDQTQALRHARQMLHHWVTSMIPTSISSTTYHHSHHIPFTISYHDCFFISAHVSVLSVGLWCWLYFWIWVWEKFPSHLRSFFGSVATCKREWGITPFSYASTRWEYLYTIISAPPHPPNHV